MLRRIAPAGCRCQEHLVFLSIIAVHAGRREGGRIDFTILFSAVAGTVSYRVKNVWSAQAFQVLTLYKAKLSGDKHQSIGVKNSCFHLSLLVRLERQILRSLWYRRVATDLYQAGKVSGIDSDNEEWSRQCVVPVMSNMALGIY